MWLRAGRVTYRHRSASWGKELSVIRSHPSWLMKQMLTMTTAHVTQFVRNNISLMCCSLDVYVLVQGHHFLIVAVHGVVGMIVTVV